MNGIVNQYIKICYERNGPKEMDPKVGCFAGFWHHRLVTMYAHTCAYRYLLFESGMKTDF